MITMADVMRWRMNNTDWDAKPGWYTNHVIQTERGIVCWHENFRNEEWSQAAWDLADTPLYKQNPNWTRLNSGSVPSWVLDAIASNAPMQDHDFTLDEIHAGQEIIQRG